MTTSKATKALGFGLALVLLAVPVLAQEEASAAPTEEPGATVSSDELNDLLIKIKATDLELQEITVPFPRPKARIS